MGFLFNDKGIFNFGRVIISCVAFLSFVIILGMWGCPKYEVYSRTLMGKAQLAEAESSRKISIEEAKAKLESAKSLALAEVERAKGVAQANKIIGESLKENEQYLRYLWIQSLSDGNTETIYVPTEANLPILEANRRKHVK